MSRLRPALTLDDLSGSPRRRRPPWRDDPDRGVPWRRNDVGEERPRRRRHAEEDAVADAAWGPFVAVGPKVRVQAQRGTRAAVIALRPGLYLVAELPEQVAKSEFGALPLLAPMMVNAARRALVEDDGGPGPLTRLFQRRDADGVRMIRARRPAQLPGPVAQAPADQTLYLPAPDVGWATDDDVASAFGCEACEGRCGGGRW
jgi:hypothetical protein